MCGRFTLVSPYVAVTERFHASASPDLHPRYNIAPGQDVLCVIRDGENRIEPLRWGLIPSWAKDPSIGNRLINARAETVAEKPSFRSAFAKRRCLVVADGFYEWRPAGKRKVPVYIFLKSKKPFGFAGSLRKLERPRRKRDPHLHDHYDRGKRARSAHPRPHARYPARGCRGSLARSRRRQSRAAPGPADALSGRRNGCLRRNPHREQRRPRRPGLHHTCPVVEKHDINVVNG